ncbi:MAG: 1-(5-phosphoribosyl)-5-[(5-phosphoribosylamino)methylideneamino]imidazole-4-carboxamide isomerase [Chitinophagaceae bacterium]|jgi:phosphoribosylformimino-5-aminoimidazole carboxamide ribotide isomerase|nr:1-(5-phosphoribosyl)-5-[(5-phosphoribosylamino)methylideneamino]imidazole-4-carboxamide isomerase [Chitinophagaceae bacterium]
MIREKILQPFAIIPAIDIIDGNCVRLVKGDYKQKTVYHADPLDAAKQFEDAGLQRLHLVDLDGAKTGRVINWKVLENISAHTKLIIDFGGGIKTEKDLQTVFNSGANMAAIGSIAVKKEEVFLQWVQQYGAAKFFLGADVKDKQIAISGWQEDTSIDVFSFIENYLNAGIQHVFCTDISKDGMLEGPATELYKQIISKFPTIHLVASGGVSNLNDLYALKDIGCTGAIVGKAFYENKISLAEVKQFV